MGNKEEQMCGNKDENVKWKGEIRQREEQSETCQEQKESRRSDSCISD